MPVNNLKKFEKVLFWVHILILLLVATISSQKTEILKIFVASQSRTKLFFRFNVFVTENTVIINFKNDQILLENFSFLLYNENKILSENRFFYWNLIFVGLGPDFKQN